MSKPSNPTAVPLRQDVRTIVLVGVAHGTSHFFHMLLPPLFPLFIRDFGFSYSELGLLVSTFFVISGVGQALSGFLVDRVGARPVLFAALGCFALAALATATAGSYAGLMLAAALAGLGNAPFHPVDFTILNKRVSQSRLGHAFSVHGVSGNLGWAAAPVFLTGIAALSGSWRVAVLCAGGWALLVLALMVIYRGAIDDRQGPLGHSPTHAPTGAATPAEHALAFLRLPAVWLCFSFFFWTSAGLSGIQGFASPAMQKMFGLPLAVTSLTITGFMLSSAAGTLAGGFLVVRAERLERLIAASLFGAAALLALVATGALPGALAALLVALAGFGAGLAGPSRDMLIRRAAPPGATGRVYGTVYSGLDLGFALSAPAFGMLLDRGSPSGVFYGTALMLLLGIASASLVGIRIARTSGPAGVAA
jgi:predicted MFS family arabinose efflux permease